MNPDSDIQIIIAINEDLKTASLVVVADEPMTKDVYLDILDTYIADLVTGQEPLDFDTMVVSTN